MRGAAAEASWIGVDWGTSHLRAWAMTEGGAARAEARSDRGMGTLGREEFEGALLELIAPWLDDAPVEVLACGMVGSRQGWAEAPYAAVPCTPLAPNLAHASATDPRLAVRIVPGIKQTDPADVMRGEETQIAGFLSASPGFDGVICLPGSHSKWVHVSAGEIVSFRTFLTGEMFEALSEHTVLRHGLTGAEGAPDMDAFSEAVSETLSRPEALAARLFGLRAEGLLDGLGPATARSRLSGLLIGAELAAARPYWLGQPVALVGSRALTPLYTAALSAQGAAPIQADGAEMTRAGLTAARARMKELVG